MAIKPLKRSNRLIPVIIIVLLGIFLAVGAQKAVRTLEFNRVKSTFFEKAQQHFHAVEKELEKNVEAIRGLGSLFASFEDISREQFSHYVSYPLSLHRDIQAFGWDPLVLNSERPDYELRAQDEGFENFMFTERTEENELVIAAQRDEYVIVYYIEPLADNKPALGYDIASNPTRLKAINHSFDTGKLTATGRINLVQETGDQFGILLLLPIYKQNVPLNSTEERRKNRKGFVVEVFRIGDLIEKELNDFSDEGFDMYLYDLSAEATKQFLYFRTSRVHGMKKQHLLKEEIKKGLYWSKTLDFGGRQWEILFSPSSSYLDSKQSWQSWAVFLSLLLLFGLIGAFVLIRIKHTHRLENILTELSESEERFRTMAEHVKEVFWIFDWDKQRVIYVNPAYEEIWGRSVQSLFDNYNEWEDSIHPDDRIYARESFKKIIETGGGEHREYRIVRPDGSVRWINDRGYAVFGEDGSISRIVGIAGDITDLKRTEEELKALSLHDDLTGLYNRRGFFSLAEQQCKIADRMNRSIALLYFDLDNMKSINDELGHKEGDRALVDTAHILSKTFRESDIIGRMGGDEFVVLITEPAGDNIESIVSRHINDNLKSHNQSEDRLYNLSLSMGMSQYSPDHPCSIGDLIRVADELMLREKKHHKLSHPTEPLKEGKTDLRKYERVKAEDTCIAEVNEVSAKIRDISLGGIGLQPSQKLPAGKDHRTVKISCPNEKVTVESMDVWSSEKKSYPETDMTSTHYDIGLKFTGLSESEKHSLKMIIFKLSGLAN